MLGSYRTCCGGSEGPIHQKYFQCRGTEQELSQCDSYDMTSQLRSRYIARIYCKGTFYVNLICNQTLVDSRDDYTI